MALKRREIFFKNLIHNGKLFYFSDQFGAEILTVNFSTSVKSKTDLEFTDLLDRCFCKDSLRDSR